MVHEAGSPVEEHSRLLKALRLADVLGPIIEEAIKGDNSMTVAGCAAECLTDEMWLAADVKVKEAYPRKSPAKVPSGKTKAMTIAVLEERYAAKEENPFSIELTPQQRVDRIWDTDGFDGHADYEANKAARERLGIVS